MAPSRLRLQRRPGRRLLGPGRRGRHPLGHVRLRAVRLGEHRLRQHVRQGHRAATGPEPRQPLQPRRGDLRRVFSSDIKSCQDRKVKVLISLGGATDTYSLTSADEARGLADYLWDNFLGGSSPSRPLGDAVLDGVDFDIEKGGGDHYDELARALASRCGGACLLTAAPQCPYPDAHLHDAIRTGLFAHVWVQFYNNPMAKCQYATAGGATDLEDAWARWTAGVPSPADVFLGLPAAEKAAPLGGYIDAVTLTSQLPVVKGAANYGGVMLWDRARDVTSGYSSSVRGSV